MAMVVDFELDGTAFMALDGGPVYERTPVANCKDHDVTDFFWDRLLEGGKEVQCGWLADGFGVLPGGARAT